jgi:hypothetical protein
MSERKATMLRLGRAAHAVRSHPFFKTTGTLMDRLLAIRRRAL